MNTISYPETKTWWLSRLNLVDDYWCMGVVRPDEEIQNDYPAFESFPNVNDFIARLVELNVKSDACLFVDEEVDETLLNELTT